MKKMSRKVQKSTRKNPKKPNLMLVLIRTLKPKCQNSEVGCTKTEKSEKQESSGMKIGAKRRS